MSKPTQNSGENTKRRGRPENLKPWQPGQSGNPGGRPKKKPITEAMERVFGDVDLMEGVFRNVLKGKSAIAKVLLTEKAADRLEGKVVQPVEAELNVNVSLSERLQKAIERAAKH